MKRRQGPPPLQTGHLFADLKASLREIAQVAADTPRLFPYGITKISLTIKVAGNELSCDVEGPQSQHAAPTGMLAYADTALVFTISERVGKKARGRLTWPAKGLDSAAVSGDSRSPDLPAVESVRFSRF